MDSNERIRTIRFTNNLKVPFTDRYDGVPVTIAPGKSDNITLEMAQHFFGWYPGADPETMFRHVSRRQGWNTPKHLELVPDGDKTLARSLFDSLRIEEVIYKLVEVDPEPMHDVPADPEADPTPGRVAVRRTPAKPAAEA